jgi:mannose-6-phosphate isomerase-like protein (cupin superfamily)
MKHEKVMKVNSSEEPVEAHGQTILASGTTIGMRLWREGQREHDKVATTRAYETAGYVISGHAELEMDGQVTKLEPGDSWIVPKGKEHRYRILDEFVAVEATSPPAHIVARDL